MCVQDVMKQLLIDSNQISSLFKTRTTTTPVAMTTKFGTKLAITRLV